MMYSSLIQFFFSLYDVPVVVMSFLSMLPKMSNVVCLLRQHWVENRVYKNGDMVLQKICIST